MDAENVFRFFHYAWGVSQRPSLFFSLFHLYTGWFYSISMKESIVKADTISKKPLVAEQRYIKICVPILLVKDHRPGQ
ncbi:MULTISPECIES: hypothetical protein [Brevibacillus]|uniref:hypothetical protein n=1 Tax=Brevibacillus TaxID=55080 RepID=UPI002E20FE96|nr:hypothetical protein [Brevibacillus borstelensis]MED2009041.1 hypothetical protein [Brevibacillus borstelensis]